MYSSPLGKGAVLHHRVAGVQVHRRAVVELQHDLAGEHHLEVDRRRGVHARLLDLYDRDRDGVITRGEYPRDDLAFRNLDRDRDGVITAADSAVKVGMPPDLAAPFLIVMRLAGPDVESIAIGDLAI